MKTRLQDPLILINSINLFATSQKYGVGTTKIPREIFDRLIVRRNYSKSKERKREKVSWRDPYRNCIFSSYCKCTGSNYRVLDQHCCQV